MKSRLQAGACVSCGRAAGNHSRICPYCDEEVWLPLWQRAGRWGWLLLTIVLMVLAAFSCRRGWGAIWCALRGLPSWQYWLGACAAGLLLVPSNDSQAVFTSKSMAWQWQARVALVGFRVCAPLACIALLSVGCDDHPAALWLWQGVALLCSLGAIRLWEPTKTQLLAAVLWVVLGATSGRSL